MTPIVTCDVCKDPIEETPLALFAWDNDELQESGSYTEFRVVHKGPCREVVERKLGVMRYADLELNDFFRYLVRNTKANLKSPFEE